MIALQRFVICSFGVARAAEAFEGAALVVGDAGVARLQALGALQRRQGAGVLTGLAETAGKIDVGRRLAWQEFRGTLQRFARIGVAAQLQPHLAQQMQCRAGIGPSLGDLGEQRFGAGEVAGGGALRGVAGQHLELFFGKSHAPGLAEAGSEAKNEGDAEKAGPARGSGTPERLAGLELHLA